jgi:hypothetical protein
MPVYDVVKKVPINNSQKSQGQFWEASSKPAQL